MTTKPNNKLAVSINWKVLVGPFAFLLLLVYDFGFSQKAGLLSALGVCIWVISWWIQQVVPIIITSILPLFLLSLTGITDFLPALQNYFSPVIQLFFGGFLLGLSLEKWKLHEKLALYILTKSGKNPRALILGIMLAAYFISMWISNTATAIMMLPIAVSIFKIVDELCERSLSKKIAYASLLGIAYGANIGGTATIIGTPPNIVLKGYLDKTFGFSPSFLEWMVVGLPFSLVMLYCSYLVFSRFLFVLPKQPIEGIMPFIHARKLQLGSMQTSQKRALLIFGSAAFFWIFSQPVNVILMKIQLLMPLGVLNFFVWIHQYFPFIISSDQGFVQLSDAGIALFFATLAFFIKSKSPISSFILTYKELPKVSWSILVMFGGGMTLAKGLSNTGFLELIGNWSSVFPNNAWFAASVFFVLLGVFLTELMSNVALTTIIIPIVFVVSAAFGLQNPLIMAIPVTLAASLAFMMPISTPPNAVVFSSKLLPLNLMIKAGFWLNLIAVLILSLLTLILYAFYA
jgi:sodium-dependent dicarboxylate transporter 2/3/5